MSAMDKCINYCGKKIMREQPLFNYNHHLCNFHSITSDQISSLFFSLAYFFHQLPWLNGKYAFQNCSHKNVRIYFMHCIAMLQVLMLKLSTLMFMSVHTCFTLISCILLSAVNKIRNQLSLDL